MIAETEVLPPEDVAPLDLAAMDPAVLELAVDAAMRERFQPSQLLAHWAERQPAPVVEQLSVEAMDLALLLGSTAEGASDTEGVALPLAMRRAILAAAGAEGMQASIMRQAPQTLVERTFCGLIEGHAPETADLDRGALLALITASGWAEGLEGAAQVSVAGTAQQARDREFVERVGGPDLGLFVGREALLRGLANLWTLPDRPVTLIEGPGGMGKSIAVARFFQSLLAGENGLPRPDAILHLDFDLPNLQVATALDLAVEVVRQLALRWTEGDPEHLLSLLRGFSSAAGSARGAARKGAASQTVVRSGPSWVTPAALLAEALARFGVGHSRPLRLVLFADSFERIQRLDEVAAGNVGQIVAALQAAGADVMAIYAARAYRDVDALGREGRVSTQRLKRFEQAEAVDYLIAKSQRRGIRLSRRDADRANRKVNGWPLGLRMAVSMLGQSAADFDVETWLASLDAGGRSIQATLYERLLDRLRDPDLRKLAKPGLIVRRLTAAVIDHVLAGPCGLDADVTGQELMHRAEDEGQLFARDLSDPGALWHRQDLREVMLPVLRIDVPAPVARAIHDGAVAFYAAEAGDVARAEELYHRLCRGDPRAAIAARWDHGAGQRLVGALDELPRAAAATLRLLLGGGRSDEAEGGLEELRAVARNRLAEGNAEQSDLFQQAGVAEDILSPLGDIRAEALLRQGMVDEVLSGAEALRKQRGVPAPVRARVAITAAGVAGRAGGGEAGAGFLEGCRRAVAPSGTAGASDGPGGIGAGAAQDGGGGLGTPAADRHRACAAGPA